MQGRKFTCQHHGCNKTFHRRDYLDRHAANHLAVRPFSCEYCDRQFSRKDLYENHLTTKFHARRVKVKKQEEEEATSGASPNMDPPFFHIKDGIVPSELETTIPEIPIPEAVGMSLPLSALSDEIHPGSMTSSLDQSLDTLPQSSAISPGAQMVLGASTLDADFSFKRHDLFNTQPDIGSPGKENLSV